MKILKKIIVIIFLALLILIFSAGNYSFAYFEELPSTYESEIEENIGKTVSNRDYSEEYKQYLLLSDEEKAELDYVPEKYDVSVEAFWNQYEKIYSQDENNEQKIATATTLPSSYDLRKTNPLGASSHGDISITVENQGPEGMCWAFGSLGALRTHLAVKGYNNKSTLNFSERHLDYLQSKLFSNKYGNTREQGSGGNFTYAYNYYKYNCGPVFETKLPYSTEIDSSKSSELQKLDNMTPDYYVHSKIDFASIKKIRQLDGTISYNSGVTDSSINEVRNKVKEHIMNNGGIATALRLLKRIDKNTNKTYNSSIKNANYYNSGYITYNLSAVNKITKSEGSEFFNAGHMVTIIGWDDNYSKDNFSCISIDKDGKLVSVKPKKNGAYIALNSYGENSTKTVNGISYISYEDYNVEKDLHGYISVNNKAQYKSYTYSSSGYYNMMKNNIVKSFLGAEDKSNTTKLTEKENLLIKKGVIKLTPSSNKIEVLDLVGNEFTTLQSVNVTSPVTGKYSIGQEITIVVTFNENVYRDEGKQPIALGNSPILKIKFGNGSEKTATFASASGKTITYKYKIESDDNGKLELSDLRGRVYNILGNETYLANVNLGGNTITAQSDITNPTVKIIPPTNKNTSSLMYVFEWSEQVKGFTVDDIIVTNGTKSSFREIISGRVFSLVVINNENGKQTVSIPAKKCTDEAGNENEASGVTVDIKMNAIYLKGDIDGNGNIGITDLLKLRRYIANSTKWNLTEKEKNTADINEDGKIDIRDVLKLRRYISANSNASIKTKHPDWVW